MSQEIVLEMKNITKEFDGNRVLEDVNFEVEKGEVHALVGANGAGKSTLMKILNGIFRTYDGDIVLDGKKVLFKSPLDAYQNGIAMIHQELDLVYNLDVSENIFLNREIRDKKTGLINRKTMRKEAQELLDSLDFPIQATEIVGKLSTAMQQLVLIARIVSIKASVVVMDEPTSSLSIKEIEKLFSVIKDLCNKGVTVIYISHFLEEIFRIANRVTVLRDGKKIITSNVKECTQKQIIEWMIGQKMDQAKKYKRENTSNEVVLSIKNFTQKQGIVKDVSFDLKKGEVLGIAGVVGSGRTELLKMVFGAEERQNGEILINGKKVTISHPSKAVDYKMAFVPEDRKNEGLVLQRSISDNIALTVIKENIKYGLIAYKSVRAAILKIIKFLGIKCASPNQAAKSLSGGNQQKVVIGKWLSVDSEILLLDQPTRGVDIGAKEEIYQLIDNQAKKGTSILFVSDEMEELLSLADRLLIMKKGHIICEMENNERHLTKVDLMTSMVSDETTQGKVVI